MNSSSILGGTELVTKTLIKELSNFDEELTVIALEFQNVKKFLLDNPFSKVSVFFQTQGRLSASIKNVLDTWLNAGALVIENNNFALASKHRPINPNYIMTLSSLDSSIRFSLRTFILGANKLANFALLPQPAVHPSHSTSLDFDISNNVITFIRIGRPDWRKWTNFEYDFCKELASHLSQSVVKLVRIGYPGTSGVVRHENFICNDVDYVDNVNIFYQSADVYIHQSRIGETFGHTVAEAVRYGLPCVIGVDYSWDMAHLELIGETGIYGRPNGLVRKAKKTLESVESNKLTHAFETAAPGASVSPKQYAVSLYGIAFLGRTNEIRELPSKFAIFSHLKKIADNSSTRDTFAIYWGILLEGLRTWKNRKLEDSL